MSEKDKANPEQRVTMEERWRAARAACDAGTCDPAEKKFHRAGCMRKIRAEALVAQEDENWGDTPVVEPSGILYDGWLAPEIPEVKVPRGGLRFPATRLSHSVSMTKDHWWSRRRYEVWTVVLGSATPSIHMGTFATRGEANEFSGNLNKLNLEINRRRDQIDDAAR